MICLDCWYHGVGFRFIPALLYLSPFRIARYGLIAVGPFKCFNVLQTGGARGFEKSTVFFFFENLLLSSLARATAITSLNLRQLLRPHLSLSVYLECYLVIEHLSLDSTVHCLFIARLRPGSLIARSVKP